MAFKQLNLDSIPITSNVEPDSIDYKYQLNLAFNSNQALFNIEERLQTINKTIDIEPNTLATLNTTLESYLYILLSITTISNLDYSKLSNYFSRKKKVDYNYFEEIDTSYLEKLHFTGYKIWGSNYGTLGYYLYLKQSNLHFASASQLVRVSFIELINRLGLDNFSTKVLTLLTSDKEVDDYNLYETSFTILKELDLVKVSKPLIFYEQWLTKVITWYSANRVNDYIKDTAEYKSYEFLLSIVREISKQGLFLNSFINLYYKFIHQEIDILVLDIIDFIISQKKLTQFEITNEDTEEEALVNELFKQPKINNTSLLIKEKTYSWLSFNLSGGLNLWLVALAAELVNRAYILSHSTKTSYYDTPFSALENKEDFSVLVNRINKLIFYAGYCLKKTNLTHLQILGSNLRELSTLEDLNNLEEYDLLA